MAIDNSDEKQYEYDPEIVGKLLASPIRPRLLSYGNENFPIRQERLQTSRNALAELAPYYDADGRYPWRLMFHPGTGLPALLRLRLHRPLSDDDQEALAEAAALLGGEFEWSYRGWTGAVFGDSAEFPNSYGGGDILQMRQTDREFRQEARRTSMRHFSWRQHFQGIPVIGGSVRLHEGVRDERVAITSSFFPIADQDEWPSGNDVWEGSLLGLRAIQAFFQYPVQHDPNYLLNAYLLALLESSVADDLGTLKVMVAQILNEWETMSGIGSEILLRLQEGSALDELLSILRHESEAAGIKIEQIPIEDNDQAILPFDGAYHLIRRYAISVSDDEAWYCDVDVHTGEALGGPWQPAIGAPYFRSSKDALNGVAGGNTAIDLSPADLADLRLIIHDADDLVDGPNATDQTRTIAVHALAAYRHLTEKCDIDPARLQGYDGHAPGLRVDDLSDETKFKWHSFYNPKPIYFDASPQIALDTGEIIYNQASDPEVILHEFIHGFMWLLDHEPWDSPPSINPFASALHEGYAMYLARSIAAPPGSGEEDEIWARGAYRFDKWKDRWALDRPGAVPGADLLPAPNVYPSGIFNISTSDPVEALRHYDVGMVWARTLWDLRKLLGPEEADWLAVQAYPYLHGYISSFELAAEGLMEADRQQRPTIDLTDAILPIWARRGISAGQGIVAFAEAGGVLIAGSDVGIYQRNGAAWQLQGNNLGGQTLRGVVALAADTANDRFYAAAHLPTAATASSQKEWTPGIYQRPASGNVWTALGDWATDTENATPLALFFRPPNQLLVATAKGVYEKRVDDATHLWQPWKFSSYMAHSLTSFEPGGANCLVGCNPAHIVYVDCGNSFWRREPATRIGDLGAQRSERLIRLCTCNNRLFLGALSGLYEIKSDWRSVKVAGTAQAVLALVAQETAATNTLFVAASDGLFSLNVPDDPAALPALVPLPSLDATVLSLHVDAAGVLQAGAQAQGIWQLKNGAWANIAPLAPPAPPVVAAGQRALLRLHQPVAAPQARITLPATLNLIQVAQPDLPLRLVSPVLFGGINSYDLKIGDVLLLVEAANQQVAVAAITVDAAGNISIT